MTFHIYSGLLFNLCTRYIKSVYIFQLQTLHLQDSKIDCCDDSFKKVGTTRIPQREEFSE